jgi:hypothetical protein
LKNALSNYLKVESPDDQDYFRQTRASTKQKQEGKQKVKFIKLWNKDWTPVSASPPRIPSNQQGLLLAVYLID